MTGYPVVEPRATRRGRWLRERRLKIALGIGVVEAILVLTSQIRWFWVLGLFLVLSAVYLWVRGNVANETARQLSWTAAFSQVVPFVVPLLWGLVQLLAIIVLVIVAVVAIALLLFDRR